MKRESNTPSRSFRRFFFRGLGIVLPTILTIWILVVVYQFVSEKIAHPINTGVQHLIVATSPWPSASEKDFAVADDRVSNNEEYAADRADWKARENRLMAEIGQEKWPDAREGFRHEWLEPYARQVAMERLWSSVKVGQFVVMDLVGLLIAAVLIYIVGALVGSYLGNKLVARGEQFFRGLPVVKMVYPHVKQVTEFFFGEPKDRMKFNKVVAVQYPRKGLWSLGLVTGDTMQSIQDQAHADCMTVFIPSSPTPFTGYVITVPRDDTIELDISIDDALRFTISGGVIVPESQVIRHRVNRDEGQNPPGALAGKAAPATLPSS